MSEDTKLQQLIINTLSPEQMPEVLSETEIYLVEDDAEYATVEELATKQDVINDLDTIRDGASKGATALQEVPSDYVKNTDYATSSEAGVVKTGNAFGTSNGALYANTLSLAQYEVRSNGNVIGKGTLENIKESLVTSVGNTKYSTLEQYNYLDEKVRDIELFKFPNAVIIGEPTISNGQVSGFSSANYMQFPFILDLHNIPFQIDFAFTTGQDVTTQQNILDSEFGLALAIKDGKGLMAISGNGISWNIGSSVGSIDILPNTTYYARLTWDGMQYKTLISTNGTDYVQDMYLVGTQRPFPRTIFIGGCSGSTIGHSPHPFFGTINMNKAFLSTRGQVIWQGMDDAGLATRADISLSNLDVVGEARFIAKQDAVDNNLTTDYKTIVGAINELNTKIQGGGYHPPILSCMWSDHLINDIQWLRGDTFSWQSGDVYVTAYNKLVEEYSTGAEETEDGITFKRTANGFKIADASQEANILSKYNADGIAWYYILDTENKRFKLPRTKFGFEGLRNNVGDDIAESLPQHTHNLTLQSNWGNSSAIANRVGWCTDNATNGSGTAITSNASSSTYKDNAPVQERATQMYLYFYVGEYTREAIEQTAGLNAELFNGKLDDNGSNLNAQGKSFISSLSFPSNRYINLELGATGSQYIAPANGYVTFRKISGSAGKYINLTNSTNTGSRIGSTSFSYSSSDHLWVSIPVLKNDVFVPQYSATGTTNDFRFVYAEGEQ